MFGTFADEFVEEQAAGFRNAKHISQWKMTLTKYAAPIREKRVDQITTDDILGILQPIWQTKNKTANQLHGHLELLLPRRSKIERGRFAAMDYKQVPQFIADLHAHEGMAALALEFLILAACRSGEVRNVQWAELDLKNRIWTIPALEMKAGREHRIPITERMVQIIERDRPFSQESLFVFPSRSGKTALSDATQRAYRRCDAFEKRATMMNDWAEYCLSE